MPGTSAARLLPAEPGTYDCPDAGVVLALGLPHLVKTLQDILDSIDERLGFLEKRADAGKLPPGGIDDDEAERYFALYSLIHFDSERPRSDEFARALTASSPTGAAFALRLAERDSASPRSVPAPVRSVPASPRPGSGKDNSRWLP